VEGGKGRGCGGVTILYRCAEVGDGSMGWRHVAGEGREGGCVPARPASDARSMGAGGMAWPCCVAGPNMGGWGANGWAPTTLEGGGG
jgi:hypothetical protein